MIAATSSPSFAVKAARSTRPSTFAGIVSHTKPKAAAVAGLVPCADSGRSIFVRRLSSPRAANADLIAANPQNSPCAPAAGDIAHSGHPRQCFQPACQLVDQLQRPLCRRRGLHCLLARRNLYFLSPTKPPARNGLSLACNGCPFRSLHSRVNVPGLLLRCLPARLPRPVRPSAPLPPPVCPSAAASSLLARCGFAAGSLGCFPCLHSPSGLLPPSGSKRSADSAAFGSPSESARFPLAPRRPLLFLGLAADHRSWSATFPEACCSSNLLEPSPLCSSRLFPSIAL